MTPDIGPTADITSILGLILQLIDKYQKKKEKQEQEQEQEHEPKNFYNQVQSLIFKFLDHNECYANSLLKEHHEDMDIYIPAVMLIKENLQICQHISEQQDKLPINDELIAKLKQQGKKLYNNPTYRLVGIGNNQLLIGLSKYYRNLSNCDAFYYGLIDIFQNYKNPDNVIIQWLTQLDKILTDKNFNDISASIGCSTLLVMKCKDTYKYFIVNSSPEKNDVYSKHVVPAFMFQPIKDSSPSELIKQLDIKQQMLREFGEELLNLEEIENEQMHTSLERKIASNPVLNEIDNLLLTGKATFKVLGLSLDIFRFRPEILSVLIIEDENFSNLFYDKCRLNWEHSEIADYDLYDTDRYIKLLTDTGHPLVSPGAACLKLGRDYALKKLKKNI